MIAIDTNILVYAHRKDSPFHKTAHRLISDLAEDDVEWCIAWPCLYEFYAVVTNLRIFKDHNATPPSAAVEQISAWLQAPTLLTLSESEETWDIVKRIVAKVDVSGAKIHDARIFAVYESHGAKLLWTADRDFSKFGGRLQIQNPL